MRGLPLLLLAPLLAAACTTAPPQPRSAQAEAELQSLLAGKVAGQPMSCLPSYRADRMVVIDDNTIAFRDGSRVYVNNLRGPGCDRLGSGFYTLITRSAGGMGLCSGEIAQVADLTSGMTVGSCALGEFTPYTRS